MTRTQRRRPARRSARRPARRRLRRTGSLRGTSHVRLRAGLLVIAMLLSVFAARLFQLQGVDAQAYATRAESAGLVTIDLPAERGRILDRNGVPLAESVAGMMIVADPTRTTADAEAIAKILAARLGLDYFTVLDKLTKDDDQTRFAYIARRIPSTLAASVMAELKRHAFVGVDTRPDPLRTYPAGDVGANLVGLVGDKGKPQAGLELNFDDLLAGKDGSETYEVGGGNRIPLGENDRVEPVDGKDLRLTIDRDVQWYSQRVLRRAVQMAGAKSGAAVVMDTRTGEVLALADYPTYDPNDPGKSSEGLLNSKALGDVYEPGSVEKVLTVAGLLDAGKVTPATRLKVPEKLQVLDRKIGDWFDHDLLRLTLAGVIAKSSNVGTAMAAMQLTPKQLWSYLDRFGLGQRTDVGIPFETRGLLMPASDWSVLTRAQVAFGQGLGVNALQMATAVNTHRQRRRDGQPEPGPGACHDRVRRRGRHRDDHQAPGGQRSRGEPDRADDGVGDHRGRRHRAGRRDPRIPRCGQDRYRAGGRRALQLLRPGRHRCVVRGLRPGGRPTLHRLRRGQEAAGRRERRRHGWASVPQDHELRAAEVRRAADRHRADPDPHAVGPGRAAGGPGGCRAAQ